MDPVHLQCNKKQIDQMETKYDTYFRILATGNEWFYGSLTAKEIEDTIAFVDPTKVKVFTNSQN